MPPSALLITAPGCPHCNTQKRLLAKARAQGRLADLTIVDATEQPELAKRLDVRSVPWLRIGELIFEGAMNTHELDAWLSDWDSPAMWRRYVLNQLESGRLATLEQLTHDHPRTLDHLLKLVADIDLPTQVRLGISAVIESFHGNAELLQHIDTLAELSHHRDHRVRCDAVYYLELCEDRAALPAIKERLTDSHPDVRELARDAWMVICGDSE